MEQNEGRDADRTGSDRSDTSARAIDEPVIKFYTERIRPLREVRAGDIPSGLQPEDVATDTVEAENDAWQA